MSLSLCAVKYNVKRNVRSSHWLINHGRPVKSYGPEKYLILKVDTKRFDSSFLKRISRFRNTLPATVFPTTYIQIYSE